MTRSCFYDWRKSRHKVNTSKLLLQQIEQIHARSRQTYGSPRVHACLRQAGQKIGRKRVARLMRQAGLKGRERKRYRICTTDSAHAYPIAPNRLYHTPPPARPDKVWVSDITYIPTDEGWLYLAGVLDRGSRYLVGWAMGATLETALPLAALMMALRHRHLSEGAIHHSDRGVQYASLAYRDLLHQHHINASMSRPGNCYDNAVMESFWSTLKHELIYRQRFATRAQAQAAIFEYIECFYNRIRLHSSLGYKSPLDYESSLN
jgi:transposase InsO family protein